MYMDSQTAPRIALLRRTLETIGADLPPEVQAALEEQDKLAHAQRTYRPTTPQDVATAVASAILDDRDPADDEEVRRLVTRQALTTNAAGELDLLAAGQGRVVAALSTSVDQVLAHLIDAANEDGEALALAHAAIGDTDDPAQIVRKGGTAADAWNQAQRSIHRLRSIGDAWAALADLTHAYRAEAPVLRFAALDVDSFETIGRNAEPWDLVKAGVTISLADREAIRARVQQLVDSRQRRDAARANDRRNDMRRALGAFN